MPQKIKIVHLITLLELGGAQGNTIYTSNNLSPEKYEVHLWAGRGAFWDNEVERTWAHTGRLKYIKSLKRSLHPFFDLVAVVSLFRSLQKLKPDILHTHSSKAGIVGRLAGWLAGVPHVIHTYHGFGFNNYQKPWTKFTFVSLERICARFSEKLIFVSKANMREAAELKIGNPEQYLLIRSGIPLQEFSLKASSQDREAGKRSLGLPPGPVITTIGAFKPQKNLIDFVKMAREVSRNHPDAHYLVVGDGMQRSLLEKTIAEFKLGDRIILLGWRRDIPALLALTDIFVLTSLWEGLPRALVEALSLGVPSFCYKTDGVSDLLENGGGSVVPQGQWMELSKNIMEALDDRKLKERLSQEAKAIIGIEFDIDHMLQQLDDLYQTRVRRQ